MALSIVDPHPPINIIIISFSLIHYQNTHAKKEISWFHLLPAQNEAKKEKKIWWINVLPAQNNSHEFRFCLKH